MRRISIIVLLTVLALIVSVRLFFVVTETYNAEANVDFSELPSLEECVNPVVVTIDKNDIAHINNSVIEEGNLEDYLRELAVVTSDACISIHISELASSKLLIKVSSIADKNGLRSQLVIIPD